MITFVVTFLDADRKNPINGETNIRLMLYGINAQKVTIPLQPKDNEGKTYASALAPSIASDGWLLQVYSPEIPSMPRQTRR
ncbi:MAG: hypothetical protein ACM3X1_05415 [Ignavibacteriales bacterium]